MNAWTPQEAGLREILQTIHESTDTQNVAVQRNITHVPLISRGILIQMIEIYTLCRVRLVCIQRIREFRVRGEPRQVSHVQEHHMFMTIH